ncbi:DUF1778 domain-containing protein [Bifidobacterium samirii]|uniref:Toxin-antitoxin system protein n=1 Tax=Bifidobacterium samirii TaxID=2306974 RepID=A0A430FVS5_9BIFI|nr:DUF1778 domain-containing protein [Bifidobacterium samirii]RSX57814.1 hypothetical protein D2E24_0662 [Bifidobacterium samirii]
MSTTITKESRFEMRMTSEQRDRIAQAAESKGMTASQWALSNLLEAAARDIQASRVVALSDVAWNDFVVALDEPMPDAAAELLGREPIWA